MPHSVHRYSQRGEELMLGGTVPKLASEPCRGPLARGVAAWRPRSRPGPGNAGLRGRGCLDGVALLTGGVSRRPLFGHAEGAERLAPARREVGWAGRRMPRQQPGRGPGGSGGVPPPPDRAEPQPAGLQLGGAGQRCDGVKISHASEASARFFSRPRRFRWFTQPVRTLRVDRAVLCWDGVRHGTSDRWRRGLRPLFRCLDRRVRTVRLAGTRTPTAHRTVLW